MKVYSRLIALVSPIYRNIIVYGSSSIIAIIFSSLNLTLLIPLLNVIFDSDKTSNNIVDISTYKIPLTIEGIKRGFNDIISYIISDQGRFAALIYICLIVLISNILSNVFLYISRRNVEKLRIRILYKLREAIFDKIVNLDIKYFNSSRKGDLMSLASSDIQIIQNSIVKVIELSIDFLRVLSYIAVLMLISTKLTIIAIIIIPISGLLISAISKKLKKQTLDSQKAHDSMISILESMIYGIKVVKSFNAVNFISDKFVKYNKLYSKLQLKITNRQLLASPVSETLFMLTAIMLILYAGYLIFYNNTGFNSAEFITYLIIFVQLIAPLKATISSITGIYTGIAAGERIFTLLDHPIEIPAQISGSNKSCRLEKGIQFNNVYFSYSNNVEVLKGVSFSIPKSKITAIVGPSGAGKSTITELILRFYDIDKGSILFDGVNIKEINLHSLRNKIAIVSQDPILFNDTIANNISFGLSGVPKHQIEYAAKMANIHDFIIGTDNGYETNVGDRGLKLSGGQKQRISLARAVCHNPDILILDEATSALDARNEKVVQNALEKVMRTCTSIVIAHRLSTVKNAHKIIVMEAGRVVESGSHYELILKGGLYKHLIDLQSFN